MTTEPWTSGVKVRKATKAAWKEVVKKIVKKRKPSFIKNLRVPPDGAVQTQAVATFGLVNFLKEISITYVPFGLLNFLSSLYSAKWYFF